MSDYKGLEESSRSTRRRPALSREESIVLSSSDEVTITNTQANRSLDNVEDEAIGKKEKRSGDMEVVVLEDEKNQASDEGDDRGG